MKSFLVYWVIYYAFSDCIFCNNEFSTELSEPETTKSSLSQYMPEPHFSNVTVNPNSTTQVPPSTLTSHSPIPPPNTTTIKPPPPSTPTPNTTTIKPPPTTTIKPPPTPTPLTTTAAPPNPSTMPPAPIPSQPDRRFDGPSFIGGIVLCLGLMAIGFVSWKFYKARTALNYHTV